MPLTYRQVLDSYDRARAFGETRSLEDYSRALNQATGSNEFDAGQRDGWWTRTSTRIDQALENSPLGWIGAGLGGMIGAPFGRDVQGQQEGATLPRTLLDTAPMYIGGPVGLAASGILSGAHTYAETGSPAAAAVSGTTAAALPVIGHGVGAVTKYITPEAPAIGRFLGSQAAQIGTQVVSGGLTSAVQGNGFQTPDIESLLLNQLPFTIFDAVKASENPEAPLQKKPKAPLAPAKPPGGPYSPPPSDPAVKATQAAAIDGFGEKMQAATSPEEKELAFKTLLDSLQNPTDVTQEKQAVVAGADAQAQTQSQRDITADYIDQHANGNYRALVGDKTYFINGAQEPEQTPEGKFVFRNPQSVKESKYSLLPAYQREQANRELQALQSQQQPELPTRPKNLSPTSPGLPEEGAEIAHPAVGQTIQFTRKLTTTSPEVPVTATITKITRGEDTRGGSQTVEVHYSDGSSTRRNAGQQSDGSFIPLDQGVSDAVRMKGKLVEDNNSPVTKGESSSVKISEPEPQINSADASGLKDMGVFLQKILRLTNPVAKSQNLLLNMLSGRIESDPLGRIVRIGGADIPKAGWMNEQQFSKATGWPQSILDAVREQAPEAFRGGESQTVEGKYTGNRQGPTPGRTIASPREVNVNAVLQKVREGGVVETRVLNVGETNSKVAELAQVEHELDTLSPDWRNPDGDLELSDRVEQLMTRRDELQYELEHRDGLQNEPESATARFSSVNPYSPEVLRGEKEVAPGERITWAGDLVGQVPYKEISAHNIEDPENPKKLAHPASVKFQSQHYPSTSGTNQLFFIRGALHEYEPGARLPKGVEFSNLPKEFYELKDGESIAKKLTRLAEYWEFQTDADEEKPFTPLLKQWEPMAYHAAVQHALALGADGIVLSDAESAMMTEGHDKNVHPHAGKFFISDSRGNPLFENQSFSTRAEAEAALEKTALAKNQYFIRQDTHPTRPTQESGMVAAYDQRGPDILRGLTGDEGKSVEMGRHENAKSEITNETPYNDEGQPIPQYGGSPVFRTPSGEPKTTNTGRLFSLDKIRGGLAADDTLSLKEAVARFEQAQQREAEARARATIVPQNGGDWQNVVPEVDPKAAESEIEAGATATQAAEGQRLAGVGKDVDEASLEQNVQSAKAKTITQQKRDEHIARGKELLDTFSRLPTEDAQRISKLFADAGKGEGIQQQGFTDNLMVVLSKWFNSGDSIDRLEGLVKKTVNRATKNQVSGAIQAPNSPTFGTPSEAILWLDQSDLDPNEWSVEKRRNKWFIGKREGAAEQSGPSLDAPVGDNSVLGSIFAPEATDKGGIELRLHYVRQMLDAPEVVAENQGVSKETAETRLKQFMHFAAIAETTQPDGFLGALNSRLEASGLPKLENKGELFKLIGQVGNWIDDFGHTYLDATLKSQRAFTNEDLKLHDSIPFNQGMFGVIRWIEQHPDVPDLWKTFARSYSGFISQLRELRMVLPGDAEHQSWATFYKSGFGVDPRVNVAWLPTTSEVAEFARQMLHEATHHLTDVIRRGDDAVAKQFNTELEGILKVLRESPLLPKKVRDLVDESLRTDAYGEMQRGANQDIFDQWKEKLGKDVYNRWVGVIYGLQNVDEMMSQIFSSREFIDHAANTEMPKGRYKGKVLNFLSEVWNKIVGGSTPTALSEILGSFDNHLTSGLMRRTYNGADFLRDRAIAVGTRPEALASRLIGLDRGFARNGLEASLSAWNREGQNGLHPVTAAQWKPIFEAADVQSPEAIREKVSNLSVEDVGVAQELFNRLRQDHEIQKELRQKGLRGEIPVSMPKTDMKKDGVVLNAMKKALDQQTLGIARRANLQHFDPLGLEQAQIDALKGDAPFPSPQDPVGDEEYYRELMGAHPQTIAEANAEPEKVRQQTAKEGSGLGFFRRLFQMNVFMRQQMPVTDPVLRTLTDEQAAAHERMQQTNFAYNAKDGHADQGVMDANDRVAKQDNLNSAASMVKLYVNMLKGKPFSWDDAFFRNVRAKYKLNSQDWADVVSEFNANVRRHAAATDGYEDWTKKYNPAVTGMVISAHEPGMKPQSAEKLAADLYNAISMDPEQGPAAQALLQNVASQMQPQTFQAALQHALNLQKVTQDFIDRMRRNPNFSSEQRFQKWHLVMVTPDKKPFRAPYDTEKEARAAMARLESQGYETLDLIPKSDANAPAGGIRPDMFQAIQELDLQRAAMVEPYLRDVDPVVKNVILDSLDRANALKASQDAWKPLPIGQRKFVAGREYIDMVENANQFYARMNQWMRHRMVKAKTDLYMLDGEIQGNRELKQYLQGQVGAYLQPDNPLVRSASEILYYSKLALNFGNMMLEGFQSATTGLQGLVRETGDVGESWKLLARANGEMLSHWKSGNWSNGDVAWFAKRAEQQGMWNKPTLSDFTDIDNEKVYRAASNGYELAKQKIRQFTTIPQRYNDRVISLAAFLHGRDTGMGLEEAYAFARDTKDRSLYTGDKAQRPGAAAMLSRPAYQMLASLQTYTLGWFNQMYSDVQAGFGKNSGLSEGQRQAARKAALYGIAAQAVLAGALGLPGVGQGIALTQQASGFDLKGWLRANLGKLFHEDEETGGFWTSLALRGVPSALKVGPLPGVDVSNRAAISVPFVGVDAYKGFDIANLTGALGATLNDTLHGLMAAAKGDWIGMQKILPSVAKGPAQLAQGDWDLRDSHGALLQKLSGAERFLMAIGVTPGTVQARRDNADAITKMNKVADARRSQALDNIASLYNKGDIEGAKLAAVAELQRNPQNPEELLKTVASKGANQVMQPDWRREVRPGVQLPFAVRTPSNEVDRLNYGFNLEAALGGSPRINPAAYTSAALTDQLLNSDPFQTVPAAREEVAKALRGRRDYDPRTLLGYQ